MVEFMDSIDDDFMETIGDNLLGIQTFFYRKSVKI